MTRGCAISLLGLPAGVKEEIARRVALVEWKRAALDLHAAIGAGPDRMFVARARFSLMRAVLIVVRGGEPDPKAEREPEAVSGPLCFT